MRRETAQFDGKGGGVSIDLISPVLSGWESDKSMKSPQGWIFNVSII